MGTLSVRLPESLHGEAVLRKVPSGEPDPWDQWTDAEPFDRSA